MSSSQQMWYAIIDRQKTLDDMVFNFSVNTAEF